METNTELKQTQTDKCIIEQAEQFGFENRILQCTEEQRIKLVKDGTTTEKAISERKKMFYSNCFIEVIKHKIKDWNNVKITYIPAKYNECFCPHFMWSDGKNDYDFGVERYLRWYERLWFKGEIRIRKLGFNQKWKAYRIAKKKKEKRNT